MHFRKLSEYSNISTYCKIIIQAYLFCCYIIMELVLEDLWKNIWKDFWREFEWPLHELCDTLWYTRGLHSV